MARRMRFIALWLTLVLGIVPACVAVAQQVERNENGIKVDLTPAEARSGPGEDGRIITAADNEPTAPDQGPGIELITGGNSTDGAARVGRLPVVD